MDLCDTGADGVPGWMEGNKGNDMRNLPVGDQVFERIPYKITNPAKNCSRAVVAVLNKPSTSLPLKVSIPIGEKAGAVDLLHTAGTLGPSKVAAAMTLHYEDDSSHTVYLLQ